MNPNPDVSPLEALDDAATIRAARLAQTQALAQQDIEAVAAYWTEDITIRRGLGHAVTGKTEARQTIVSHGNVPSIIYQRMADEVLVSAQWPLAYETGSWQGHLDSADGPVVIGGRYSAQWVKRNEAWLIRAEVFVALTGDGIGCDFAALP